MEFTTTIVSRSLDWQTTNVRTILLATIVFLLAYLLVKSRQKWNTPPGPRSLWPILGHLATLDRISPYRTIATLAKTYGPIISLKFGSFPVVVLNDYSLVHQAFVKQGYEFDDRPDMVLTQLSKGKGLVMVHSSEAQRSRRRFAMASLRALGMGKFRFEEQIVAEIQRLLNKFTTHGSKPFCPFELLEAAFSNVLCCLAFGTRYDYDDPKFQRLLRILYRLMEIASYAGAVNFIPILRYIPLSGTRELRSSGSEYRAFFTEMVKENAKDYIPNQPRNFIDMYLDYQQSISSQDDLAKAFNNDDLIRCLGDLFGAGTETSATTTKWALLYMMLNPNVQSRVQQELDEVVGRNRPISLKDRQNLPYTEATLMEIQRVTSILPLGAPRATNVDTTLNGYDIPRGTIVMPNLWAIHHDSTIWNKPAEFRPERFLNEQGSVVRREELIPFSIGRRECLGKQLVQMELFLYFSHLMSKFTFTFPEGAPSPNMQGIMGNTLAPAYFEVCATPREA
ncbi:cytochrome P450 2U1-like [Amphiura filiformis]|uniref:cytochrome P450 2U1-like n=1 Tax=Amphiura filiformis TaxID=82378 RepID=UPI003B228800